MRRFISAVKNKKGKINIIGKRGLIFFVLFFFVNVSYAQNFRIHERTSIYLEKIPGDSVALKVYNDFAVPITLKLDLKLENLQGDSPSELVTVVSPKVSGQVIATFKRVYPEISYSCSYNWSIVLGDSSRIPDSNYVYSYPFSSVIPLNISQGPGGSYSHEHIFAYDFAMPVGTPVAASRDGIVAVVKSNSTIGGPDKKYIEESNFISILHSDGTIANYLHLEREGVLVKEGQMVKKGEIIGYSGNTGFSSGPHLHFEVISSDVNTVKKNWIEFKWQHHDNKEPSVLYSWSD